MSDNAYGASTKPDYTIHVGRDRAYNSKAKNLIYGGDVGRPLTPVKEGKKSVPHALTITAPFATVEAHITDGGEHDKQYTPKHKNSNVQGKVNGNGGFDPEVYKSQIESNFTNMQASKQRAYAGNGIFGAPQ